MLYSSLFRPYKKNYKMTPGDVFIGYHSDTISAVVLQVCQDIDKTPGDECERTDINDWERQVLKMSII